MPTQGLEAVGRSTEPLDRGARRRPASALAVILGLAVVVRLPLLWVPGYPWDIRLFSLWAQTASQSGLAEAILRPDMDYVGYNYVLMALGWLFTTATGITDLASTPAFGVVLKLVPLAADLGVTAVLFTAARRWAARAQGEQSAGAARLPWLRTLEAPERTAVLVALLYALNPATLYVSNYWGQIDSVTTAAMLGSLLLVIGGRPGWAGAVITLGFLVKPHPIVIAPLLTWAAFWSTGLIGVARGWAVAGLVLVAGLAPFWLLGVGDHVREIYRHLFEVGDQISVSAWNGWWIAFRERGNTYPLDPMLLAGPLTLTISQVSKGLLGIAVAVAVLAVGPRPTAMRVMLPAAFLALSFFMLTMKMHERYLFPVVALLAPAAVILGRRWLVIYVALSVTFLVNLVSIYPFPPPPLPVSHHYIGPPTDVALSLLNIALHVIFTAFMLASAGEAWAGTRWPSVRAVLRGAETRAGLSRFGPNVPYRDREAALYSPANPKGKGWS